MKKLSVLIALALCLTIGGAYAAWTYSTGAVANASVTDIKVGMEVDEVGSKGTLSATFTPSYEVVPSEVGGVKNIPSLKNNDTTQNLVIKFVPGADAEQDVKDNAIAISVTLSVGTDFTGTKHEITYTIVITENTTHGSEHAAGSWVEETDGSFTITITSDTVLSWMKVDSSKALTDVKNAEAFETAVKAGAITITVAAQ